MWTAPLCLHLHQGRLQHLLPSPLRYLLRPPLRTTAKLSLRAHRPQDVDGMSTKPVGLDLGFFLHFLRHRCRHCCRLEDDRRWVPKISYRFLWIADFILG